MKHIFPLLCLLVLSACSLGPRNASTTVYDFGLPAERLSANHDLPNLAIEVNAPTWLDTRSINYRLSYIDAQNRREYADSRWAGTPSHLLEQSLRQQLGTNSSVADGTACLIQVELQEFGHIFNAAQSSHGLLQASAVLIGAQRQIIAERTSNIQKPAKNESAGGVKALAEASIELGQELTNWLGDLQKTGKLSACRRY